MKMIPYILALFLLATCHNTEEMNKTREKKPQDPNRMVLTGPLVEKPFYKKNGEKADFTELYLRASVQDYFIKFCESEVGRTTLEPYIDQVISVQGEIKNGNWDICPGDPQEMQSRIGYYLIIKSIQ